MEDYGKRIVVSSLGGITLVALQDEEILDESTINEIAEALFTVVKDKAPVRLVLSFVKVKFLSSSALGTLIRLNKRVEESKGKLKLCDIKDNLYEIFIITKLNKLFDIYEDKETAMGSFD